MYRLTTNFLGTLGLTPTALAALAVRSVIFSHWHESSVSLTGRGERWLSSHILSPDCSF